MKAAEDPAGALRQLEDLDTGSAPQLTCKAGVPKDCPKAILALSGNTPKRLVPKGAKHPSGEVGATPVRALVHSFNQQTPAEHLLCDTDHGGLWGYAED